MVIYQILGHTLQVAINIVAVGLSEDPSLWLCVPDCCERHNLQRNLLATGLGPIYKAISNYHIHKIHVDWIGSFLTFIIFIYQPNVGIRIVYVCMFNTWILWVIAMFSDTKLNTIQSFHFMWYVFVGFLPCSRWYNHWTLMWIVFYGSYSWVKICAYMIVYQCTYYIFDHLCLLGPGFIWAVFWLFGSDSRVQSCPENKSRGSICQYFQY